MTQLVKVPYVCGPLTELPPEIQKELKDFYSQIGDLCGELTGDRAFVPHEHFDPEVHPHFTPAQVDENERRQVCEGSSLLIIVTYAPSWGGGIEVEMAHRHGVPGLLLVPTGKRVSRLLRGNPAIKGEIQYESYEDAIAQLRSAIPEIIKMAA